MAEQKNFLSLKDVALPWPYVVGIVAVAVGILFRVGYLEKIVATVPNRVLVLETNYDHIKEGLEEIKDILKDL